MAVKSSISRWCDSSRKNSLQALCIAPSILLFFSLLQSMAVQPVMIIGRMSFCHSEHFFFVIPNASEESSMDASLRSA
jgi:hypothetical protein